MSVSSPPLARCPDCRYDLTGLPERHRCPECGFEYDPSTRVFRLEPSDLWIGVTGQLGYAFYVGMMNWAAPGVLGAWRGPLTIVAVAALVVAVSSLVSFYRHRPFFAMRQSGIQYRLPVRRRHRLLWSDLVSSGKILTVRLSFSTRKYTFPVLYTNVQEESKPARLPIPRVRRTEIAAFAAEFARCCEIYAGMRSPVAS